MDKNDQINKFVEFSKEIIKTEGINEETLSKISKELSKLSNIEDLFRFGNHRGRGANAAESYVLYTKVTQTLDTIIKPGDYVYWPDVPNDIHKQIPVEDDAWVIIYMGRNAFDTERIVYD